MERDSIKGMIKRALKKHKRNIFLIIGSGVLLLTGVVLIWGATLKIPDINLIEGRRVEQSTKIYDRTGTILLDDLSNNMTRTIVPLAEISPLVQKAAIAIEDAEFYSHNGIRISSIIRAVLANLVPGGYTGRVDNHPAGN